jgi:rod shape-determining protein MreD|tara:strand:- start:6014 stop:6511 length:498 start_codon:yes stop_codon:yes gene_type:complete
MPSEIKNNQNKVIAFLAILICIILILIPTPDLLKIYKPDWSLLLLIFLAINIPKEFNLGMAFLVGLLVDVSKGSLLGQHALASLLIIFLVTKFHLQLRIFPFLQLTAVVCFLIIIYQFILFWINGVSGISSSFASYLGPIISGTILWPIIAKLLGQLFIFSTTKK